MKKKLNKLKFDSVEVLENTHTYEHQLKFDAKKPRFNHKGWLLAEAIIAKVGVIDRTDVEAGRREFISEDELFKQDSLDTITALDIEKVHKSGNDVGVVVGSPYKIKNDNGVFLAVPIAIKDKNAIQDAINNSYSEVSPEYENIDIPKKGKFDGQDYTFEQTQRIYQKIALVRNGTARGGRHVKVKLDSTDVGDKYLNYSETPETNKNNNKEETRVKMLIDGLEVDLKANDEKIVQKALNDRDSNLSTVKSELEVQKAKYDSLNEQLEAEKEKVKKFDSVDHLENAKQRLKLEDTLKPVMGSSFKFDGLTDIEIKKQALVKMKPEIDLKDKSDDYISARFDSVLETDKAKYDAVEKQADASIQNLGGGVVPPKQKLSIVDEISNILAGA